MKQLLSLLSLSALLLASCSKSSDTTSSNNNNNGGGNGGAGTDQIVATVSGTAYTMGNVKATKVIAGGFTNYGITPVDSGSTHRITIALANVTGTGTYDIGTILSIAPPSSIGLSYGYTDTHGNPILYNSDVTKGTKVGTITISTFTSTNIQGTFSATLPIENGAATGAPASITITNGGFNATIQ